MSGSLSTCVRTGVRVPTNFFMVSNFTTVPNRFQLSPWHARHSRTIAIACYQCYRTWHPGTLGTGTQSTRVPVLVSRPRCFSIFIYLLQYMYPGSMLPVAPWIAIPGTGTILEYRYTCTYYSIVACYSSTRVLYYTCTGIAIHDM